MEYQVNWARIPVKLAVHKQIYSQPQCAYIYIRKIVTLAHAPRLSEAMMSGVHHPSSCGTETVIFAKGNHLL